MALFKLKKNKLKWAYDEIKKTTYKVLAVANDDSLSDSLGDACNCIVQLMILYDSPYYSDIEDYEYKNAIKEQKNMFKYSSKSKTKKGKEEFVLTVEKWKNKYLKTKKI